IGKDIAREIKSAADDISELLGRSDDNLQTRSSSRDDKSLRQVSSRTGIGEAISRASWSKGDLARAVGMSERTISKWVRGEGSPNEKNMRRLLVALNERLRSQGKEEYQSCQLFPNIEEKQPKSESHTRSDLASVTSRTASSFEKARSDHPSDKS